MLAFPDLVPAEEDHPNTAPMNRVRDALRSWTKPALVVWGADDAPCYRRSSRASPNSSPAPGEPVVLAGAAHFLQEDAPAEVASAILDFAG